MSEPLPVFADVVAALGRIGPQLRRTPVVNSPAFDALCGRRVHLKCENLQHGGAFKFRGALNAVLQLPRDGSITAVATHSSGNHGAALALAAQLRGLACHVVMPDVSSLAPREARPAGAHVMPTGHRAARGGETRRCAGLTSAHLETRSTTRADLRGRAQQRWSASARSPTAIVTAADLRPDRRGGLRARGVGSGLIAVEPAAADDACRSFRAGRRLGLENPPQTIADGLRATIGVRNFELLRRHVDDVLTVEEGRIVDEARGSSISAC